MTTTCERQSACFRCVACGIEQTVGGPVLRADPDRRPFDLVRCTGCGLVQQHPRYTAGQIKALYRDDYYVFAEEESHRWARAVQQYVVHLLPWEAGRRRRLLDVGCALGHLAALAERRGWRTVGIDISPEAVSRAASRFGLDFRAGALAQFRETLAPFDVVFLGDVIEHVPEPVELLHEVGRVLAPSGVVCIDTPNWAGRWRRFGGARWLGLNKFHVNLFDAGSLTRLLESCDYAEIRTGSYTHCRYESWANRPEVQAIIGKPPRALAWRLSRILARRGNRGPWAVLRTSPPTAIDDASRLVTEFADLGKTPNTGSSTADNLIATARRG